MDFLTKLCLVPVFLKAMNKGGKPIWCSVIYTLALLTNGVMFDMALGKGWLHESLELALQFGLATAYFYLLKDLEGSGAPYWGVLIVGLGLLLFL